MNVAKHSTDSPPALTVPEVKLGGLSFVAIPRVNKAPQPDTLRLLACSGSSDHYFDDTIIPGLENLMFNVEMLNILRKIFTADNNALLGPRTDVLPGIVDDKDGRQHSVQIPGVIVSGMGCHLLSSKKAVDKGMSAIINSNLRCLQQGELVLPLQQRYEDSGLYSFELALTSADKAISASAANDFNLWRRRMGHLNAQSLRILNSTADNVVERV